MVVVVDVLDDVLDVLADVGVPAVEATVDATSDPDGSTGDDTVDVPPFEASGEASPPEHPAIAIEPAITIRVTRPIVVQPWSIAVRFIRSSLPRQPRFAHVIRSADSHPHSRRAAH
jgi:hypothetical protein